MARATLQRMSVVFRKTAKGQAEIETRADRLAPSLRTALILVDGRRDGVALAKFCPSDPESTLAGLLDGGYIEMVEPPAEVVVAAAAAESPPGLGPRQDET